MQILPLSIFLHSYRPIRWVDGEHSWQQVAVDMMDDPFVAPNIIDLARQYLAQDGFRRPVCVSADEDGIWRVDNGTHRVVASMLVAAPSITFVDAHSVDDEDVLRVHFQLFGADTETDPFVALRSFPLDDATWIEADVMSGLATGYTAEYYLSPQQDETAVINALVRRATIFGWTVGDCTWKRNPPDDED